MARGKRCGSCAGCRAKACGECLFCDDDPQRSREHLCIKRRCVIEWEDAVRGVDADANSPEVECEYCQRRERELCSPMVIDLSPEATEKFLKLQDAEKRGDAGGASEGPHRKVRFPRFPRARHGSRRGGGREAKIGSSRLSGPTVHEVCAQAMFKARAERTQDKLRGLREQEAEEAIRMEGCRTKPLGRDRHGRYYFRLPGDSRRVFVGPASINPSNGGEEYGIGDGGGVAADKTSLLLPPDPMVKDFQVYESEGDLEALVAWFNESGRREGPLRAALLLAFPYLRSKTFSAVTERAAGATGGKRSERTDRAVEIAGVTVDDGAGKFAAEQVGEEGDTPEYSVKKKGKGKAPCRSGETISRGTMKEDDGYKGCNGDTGGSYDDGTRADGGEARPGSPASPASPVSAAAGGGACGGGSGHGYRDGKAVLAGPSRNRELRQLLEEGLVELELVLDPSEPSNTVVAPASEVFVEFDNDGEVQEDDEASGRDGPVMTWTRGKYHAVRLRHTPTAEVFLPSQKQGIILVFEIWRGGHMVGRTLNETPYDKRTGVYFFTIPKFLRTGPFRLVFDVMDKQPLHVDPVANEEEPGELAPRAPPRRFAKVTPIELNLEVIPRFTQTGGVAALHKLRAMGFRKQRHRHETETIPMSLDLPFDSDELTCLKAALLTMLKALPRGALLEGNDGIAAQNAHSGRGDGEKGLGAAEPGWAPQLRDYWLLHVGSATSCQELMEALLLLESCLDPKWLKRWYAPAQEKMASTSYLLRLATPAAVALHLFSLDRAIHYDKVSTAAHRGARLRNGVQLRGRAGACASTKDGRGSANGRRSKTSMHASASSAVVSTTPPKTRGRQTRTSRAADAGEDLTRSPPRRGRPSGGGRGAKSTTRDVSHSPESWEDGDDADDDEDEDDSEDWEPGHRSRGGSSGSGAGPTRGTGGGRRDRGRRRPVTTNPTTHDCDDMDVDEEESGQEDEESEDGLSEDGQGKRKATAAPDVTDVSVPVSTSWDCPRCTVDNDLANTKCHLCGERRPASAISARAMKRRRQLTAGLDAGNNGGGGSGSNSNSSAENNAATDGDASAGGARNRKRRRGKSNTGSTSAAVAAPPRQRRNVARVNYAEDEDEEEDESGGGGGRGTASAGGHRASGSGERGEMARAENSHLARIRPLRMKEELRRGGGKEEEGLADEVRAFRRRVRSVVQSFSGEEFTLHFREPVDLVMYPSYVDFVSEAMDLSTILFNLRSGVYDDVRDQSLLLRHINLIPTNCEAFNGKDVKITQNARLVARTFVGRLSENEPAVAMAAGLGESFSTFGGGVGSVCSACGVRLERGDDSLELVSCEACKAVHHAICVLDPSGDAPWRCVACGGEN